MRTGCVTHREYGVFTKLGSTRFEILRSGRLHVAGEVAVWIWQRQRLASKFNAGLGDLAGLSLPSGFPMTAGGASAPSLFVAFAIDYVNSQTSQ